MSSPFKVWQYLDSVGDAVPGQIADAADVFWPIANRALEKVLRLDAVRCLRPWAGTLPEGPQQAEERRGDDKPQQTAGGEERFHVQAVRLPSSVSGTKAGGPLASSSTSSLATSIPLRSRTSERSA